MIPRIIHQVWLYPPMEYEWFHTFDLHNKTFNHILWTKDNLPGNINPDVLAIIRDESIHYILKADLIRYELLRIFGGFYADMDMECLKSLEPLCQYDFVCGIDQEKTTGNAFIGCSVGNAIIERVCRVALENIKKSLKEKLDVSFVLNTSGPLMFHREIIGSGVTVFEEQYFSPVNWNGEGRVTEKSYVNHHYKGAWIKTFSMFEKVCELLRDGSC